MTCLWALSRDLPTVFVEIFYISFLVGGGMPKIIALLVLILLSAACGMQLPEQVIPSPHPVPVPLRYAWRFETAGAIDDMYWNDDVLEWRVK